MIYHLNGLLISADPAYAVIECAGVGYRMAVSRLTASALMHRVGEQTLIYTHLQVKEDGVELFGFAKSEEADAFRMLITVSGVGPKAAISILSLLSPAELSSCILTGDAKRISGASGVGPKTAARVILELKDKVGKRVSALPDESIDTLTRTPSDSQAEAINALLVLGFRRGEAAAAVAALPQGLTTEQAVREALKRLTDTK